jgi:Family of unknown function (DUF5706)
VLSIKLALDTMSNGSKPRDGLDFAWRVHAALDSWTGKVDVKASIALAIESAVFGFVVTLSSKGERFAALAGSRLDWYRIGLGFLLFSVLASLAVVLPQLNRWKSRRDWRGNMIYFGHLRHWDAQKLAKALKQDLPYEEQLARQLVSMSKIAWRKHAWLQWSLISLVIGSACLIGVAVYR